MKNFIITAILLLSLLTGMTACYSDKGNYDYTTLPKLSIESKDTVFATQFTTLEIPVDIEFTDGDKEENYDFSWRIWANDVVGTYNQKKDICLTKDLNYEVTEVPGSYTLTLTCHNRDTGVDTYKSIFMTVQGIITEGFMVLNEKNGVTDFDLIISPYFTRRVTEDVILRDVYESVNNERLQGRGVKIGSFFSIGRYQAVVVLTDKGGARLDVSTMLKTYDMSTLSRLMDNYHPENYLYYTFYYGPGRFGFDAIISDGRFYVRSDVGYIGFDVYTEPIRRDGFTYHACAQAPRYISYCQGIIYDDLHDRFIRVSNDNNTWEFVKSPNDAYSGKHFTESDVKGELRYINCGFRFWEYGLFKDRNTGKHKILAFNFTEWTEMDQGKYELNSCPELDDAKFFETGTLGPIFYYATEHDIYLLDYEGSGNARKVYTLANPDEKITCMKLYKPWIHRYLESHPYESKVLFVATYNESTKQGKLYMYNVNVSNGTINTSTEKIIDGFGEILDMECNFAKYGT